ncbi:mineralocorticoid receptor [Hippocampus comes]|uniref:Nuclear receptor subfamily 3, group C, member 2 n=1 Tax=Hippocampus comes TaxID=109280 RepID=A0A3Q2XKG4_HIPCM|nr:PREDICTED: mineralocorticoid receptor [Hippocampus comes]
METKRYQSLFEGSDTENRWSQIPSTMEFGCAVEDSGLDMANVADPKAGGAKKPEQPALRPGPNQHFGPPHISNCSLHGAKPEMDSKELSKTVAESMGLYMNAAREADFAFGQHGGSSSPGKMQYPVCGRPLGDSQRGSAKSPKLKGFAFPPPSGGDGTVGAPASSASMLASSLSGSPQTSSPGGGNNMVSSTTTSPPAGFGPACSPVSHPALSGARRRNPSACSPVESSTVGSPPLLRSPMSSPRSMMSVRSPQTCSVRSSASSPAAVRPPACSPAMAIGSPQNPSSGGFPAPSPTGELGLARGDTRSPEATALTDELDFKPFEFPKVEMVDGEVFNVGLDQMGMVKYIKNEPGTDFRSMCLGGSKCNTSSVPFITQIKNEPDKSDGCMNAQSYGEESPPLGLFPASETTYLSLRNNVDEYSLSGILGPPVSLNGNYDADVFANDVLSKGVKQESSDGDYYQESNGVPASAIVGVNSSGHSFHYQIGTQGTMSFARHDVRDQSNPLLNLISPVAALMESWKSRPGMPQGSLSARGDGYPGQNCISDGMVSSPLRQPSSTAKVCLVCGDEASGCHYGVVTCGSCKVFFKRAVEGQHNYLCAGRNDCIIDKIRRKNCPACRVRKCLQAGMNLGARKSKKLGKLKGVGDDLQSTKESQPAAGVDFLSSEKELNANAASAALMPRGASVVTPFLPPSICSVLELIEPEEVYSGFDNTQPDTTDHLLSSLNCLAGKQMVRMVKWAKVLPGFRGLPIEDQITLIQYSWMCLSSFCLGWRSYKHTNGQLLYFAPDLIFNEDRMQQSAMYSLCLGMRQVSQEFVRLQLTYNEFLSMKVLLLLSTIPKEGLKNQAAFEEMRVNYIKELRRSVGKATNNSGQTWQRFFQLTKLLDAMHGLVANLLDFCFYTFRESRALKVAFPDMLVEIISDQIPKVESGLTHTIYFHKK